MQPDIARLRALLDSRPAMRLLAALRRRVELGQPLSGSLTLTNPSHEERRHMGAIFGRETRGRELRISLEKLEEILVEKEVCVSLADALDLLCGEIPNQRAIRNEVEDSWNRVWQVAADQAGDDPVLRRWLEHARRTGVLRRVTEGDASVADKLLRSVFSVWLRLPADDIPLAQLAAETIGDSHALDRGQALSNLMLRALSQRSGIEYKEDAECRRLLWASVKVLCDELSAPILTLNLPATEQNLAGKQICLAAECGEPVYLSVRQLMRAPPTFFPGEGRTVFVCENPAVVAAATALGPAGDPLICLHGQPKTASRLLLDSVSRAGWNIACHGDFDWKGLEIVQRMIARHQARAWRMSSADYESAEASVVPLSKKSFKPSWDGQLFVAMRRRGRAVYEEQVLTSLLSDLHRPH